MNMSGGCFLPCKEIIMIFINITNLKRSQHESQPSLKKSYFFQTIIVCVLINFSIKPNLLAQKS